jgi:squalene-hopene/tetraprenyl-beta-curcumene cyclase
VLSGLAQIEEDMSQPYIRKAVAWLKACQNPDYGWGESCSSYGDASLAGKGESTPSQTAWALLGLMAVGEVNSAAVQRGIHYLLSRQNEEGDWYERHFTGTGFPRVFYLRYHGYARYFPLWALGVYRRLRTGKRTRQDEVRLAIDGRHG